MGNKTRFYVDVMASHPEVTGSCLLVIVKYPDGGTNRFIVDCGLFQEKEYSDYNNGFPFEARNIDFCLITHNHIDHIGRLPLLTKEGFCNKIYTTQATSIFSGPALMDSYSVLKDLAKRNHTKQLYSEADVVNTRKLIEVCEFEKTIQVAENIKVMFLPNGHLLGAALILVQISYPGEEDINLLFTGDYNSKNMFFKVPPIPEWIRKLPLTIIQESTYGAMDSSEETKCFEQNILNCIEGNGSVVCMVFSLGRSQEILYTLKKLQDDGKLSTDIPIYFDGKLGQRYTKLYLEEDLGICSEMKEFLPQNLTFVDKATRCEVVYSQEQKIVVTTSGMGTYGPAQIYIPEYITRKNCLLQFTGYTAEGTLGRKLKDTEQNDVVTIGSIIRKKRARVEYTTEFSAHAKADQMIDFLRQFEALRLVLVNHGETETKNKFSERIVNELDPKCVGILNREYFFRVGPYGLIRQLSTKFN